MSRGLTDEWRGCFVAFNVEGKDSYPFANAFYHLFVTSFDESCERVSYYDRVQKIRENEAGKAYWVETDDMAVVSYDMADSFMFRTFCFTVRAFGFWTKMIICGACRLCL